jgi:hypothetical protein
MQMGSHFTAIIAPGVIAAAVVGGRGVPLWHVLRRNGMRRA